MFLCTSPVIDEVERRKGKTILPKKKEPSFAYSKHTRRESFKTFVKLKHWAFEPRIGAKPIPFKCSRWLFGGRRNWRRR